MKPPSEIARLESHHHAAVFNRTARHLLEAGAEQGVMAAHKLAISSRAPTTVIDALKTAVMSGSIAPTLGEELVSHPLSEGHIAGLRGWGFFDRLLADAVALPFNSLAAIVTSAGIASVSGELAVRPVMKTNWSTAALVPFTSTAIIVTTTDLARLGGQLLERLLHKELSKANTIAVDKFFVASLTSLLGSPPSSIAGSGADADDVYKDLRALLALIATDEASKVHLAADPAVVKKLSLMSTLSGERAFPEIGLAGGTLAGMPITATPAAASGEVIAVDASSIGGNAGAAWLDVSEQAMLEMDTTPYSPPNAAAVMQSLWQSGKRAIKSQRTFGFGELRPNNAAKLTAVAWGTP
jgi:hypothetical protein